MKPLLMAALLLASPVNLKTGEPAPFDGALVDPPTAEQIRVKRAECEEQNKRLQEALAQKPEASGGPSIQTTVIVALATAALGFVAGVILVRK